jgi:hypothetical protein
VNGARVIAVVAAPMTIPRASRSMRFAPVIGSLLALGAFVSGASVARAQEPGILPATVADDRGDLFELTRRDLVALRAEARRLIAARAPCSVLAREVRDVVTALLAARPGPTRRALVHYLAAQRERWMRCSVGAPLDATIGAGSREPARRGRVRIVGVRSEPPDVDAAGFGRSMRVRQAAFRYCYERSTLARDRMARGDVVLRATVRDDLTVGGVEVVRSDAALTPESIACGRAYVQRLPRQATGPAAGTHVVHLRFDPEPEPD